MTELGGLRRHWRTNGVPGLLEREWEMYWPLDLDAMPSIGRTLDGTLDWLLEAPSHVRSLERGPDDATQRDASPAELRAIAPNVTLSGAFRRFVEDPEPRRHIRSATACYLDLGHFPVRTSDGGTLIHFLSDQQWVFHWLIYVGSDGLESVIGSPSPLGFDDGQGPPRRLVTPATDRDELDVCSDTFEEFLYRYWAENELFFRLAVDGSSLNDMPAELREYANGYPRDGA